MKFYMNPDHPLIQLLVRVANLMLLNILFLLTCVPLVSVGAGISALHYTVLKILTEKEDSGICRLYWRAFRENFRQATPLWLGFLLLWAVILFDVYVIWFRGSGPSLVVTLIAGVLLAILMTLTVCCFVLLGKFRNSTGQTLKNALIICMTHFLPFLIMSLVYLSPIVLAVWVPRAASLSLVIGFSGSAYANGYIWRDIFAEYQPPETPALEGEE